MAKVLWTQRSSIGPSGRTPGAMAFDSLRGRSVLFGGSSFPALLRDTWEWDGSFWTQMEDTGPTPRFLSAMAYDSVRQVAILFGGRSADPDGALNQHLGDTWMWDGEDWTQLSDSGPSARSSHAMAFDIARRQLVLFGGQGGDNENLNDTWTLEGEEWTQQEDTGPVGRGGHSIAYDVAARRTVMFGGIGSNSTSLSDTWTWDGNKWVQIAEFGPSARLQSAMASAGGSGVVLFGGLSSLLPAQVPQVLGDTWELNGKHWTQRQDLGPGPLHNAPMVFDRVRNRAVLFGGLRVAEVGVPKTVSDDTWESPLTSG